MFKAAATKLAHNSTIPALAGNSDLKPLQEIIATQKRVLQSLQRLSTDVNKSTEALRTWAKGEGGDLDDTISACSTLLNHWATSLTSFASHFARIRECVKTVRTKEEALDDMQCRRKSVASKAEVTEKRLSKMGFDNKNFQQQTDVLTVLRAHIRVLDVKILNEEATLGDWKRVKVREWMGVLLGGLLECSEKGTVVAEYGRAIVGYVSTQKTQPGHPRALYYSHSHVGSLVGKAERELINVSFTSELGDELQQPPNEDPFNGSPERPPPYTSQLGQSMETHMPQFYAPFTLSNNSPINPFEPNDFGEYSPHPHSQTYAPGQQTYLPTPDQLSPVSPTSTRSRFTSFQEGSMSTHSHRRLLSQSSISSGFGSIPTYTPLNPIASSSPLLSQISHLHLTTPGS
ncbi:hypothetical protein BJ322DRAFT_4722 [Thelephora terrestris]|uniref:Uncharacterized protein n=1 Tax=Thelephora terrestris TaxID=56493 RepID=A0A9P6HNT5_9AGAM|nr:hypothetical protein BJ322DRAFT_4722 [Thelephora terrestris]